MQRSTCVSVQQKLSTLQSN